MDQTYLEHQARMIGRAVLLKYNRKISKLEFDKYTYIITRLNNHLTHLIELIYQPGKDIKANPTPLENDIGFANGIEITSRYFKPNMDLISFGFLEEYSDEKIPSWNPLVQYRRTEFFYDFYENIFKDQADHMTNVMNVFP